MRFKNRASSVNVASEARKPGSSSTLLAVTVGHAAAPQYGVREQSCKFARRPGIRAADDPTRTHRLRS